MLVFSKDKLLFFYYSYSLIYGRGLSYADFYKPQSPAWSSCLSCQLLPSWSPPPIIAFMESAVMRLRSHIANSCSLVNFLLLHFHSLNRITLKSSPPPNSFAIFDSYFSQPKEPVIRFDDNMSKLALRFLFLELLLWLSGLRTRLM